MKFLNPSRWFRAALALPELWEILILVLVFSLLRPIVPQAWQGSLGWTINPYQVFAVFVSLAWFMLPGAMLIRFLRIGGSWLTRLPTYMAAAVGIWSIPAFLIGASAQFDVKFLFSTGIVINVVFTLAALLREVISPSPPLSEEKAASDEGRKDYGTPLNTALVVAGIAAMIIVVYTSFNAPIAVDDSLQTMYVQDDLAMPRINQYEPVFDAGIPPSTRGSLTTWPLNLTVISYMSGLPAQQAFWLLKTFLLILDIFAIYALALRLFGKRNQALFTMLAYILIMYIYVTDADSIGFSIFARGAQDKFVARYTMLPIVLAWSLAYLQKPDRRIYWLAGVVTIGIATTHPIGIFLLGIPLAGMGVVHVINHGHLFDLPSLRHPRSWLSSFVRKNWEMLRPLVFLAVFSLLGVIVPLLQKSSPDAPIVAYSLTDTRDPTLWFRVNLAINFHRLYIANFLGPKDYIVHPKIFLDADIVIPYLLLPIVWLKARKKWVSELITGTFLLTPVLLMVPPIIQFIGTRATPWLLYRFAWPLSLLGPLMIAWFVWALLERISQRFSQRTFSLASPLAVLVIAGIAVTPQIKGSITQLVESRQDGFDSQCRNLQSVYSLLPALVGNGTQVLSTFDNDLCIASSAAYANPIEFGLTTTINRYPASRIPEAEQRLDDVYTFSYATVVDQNFMDILTRWNVGLILIRADAPIVAQLNHLPQYFKLVVAQDRYLYYRILPTAGTNMLADMSVKDRWKIVKWQGNDPLIAANTLWKQDQFDEAIKQYQALTSQRGDEAVLAWTGLGRAYLSSGQLDQAVSAFNQEAQLDPGSPVTSILAGNASMLQGDYPAMAKAYTQAVQALPWHPEALTRLGDAYRLLNQPDLAHQYYQQASMSDATPGSSMYYRLLGSKYLSANWNEDAIAAFKKAISIRDLPSDYAAISQAFFNINDYNGVKWSADQAYQLDKWSDLPGSIRGRLQVELSNPDAAVKEFQAAIRNNAQSAAIQYLASAISTDKGNADALSEIQKLVGYRLGFAEPVMVASQQQFALGQVNDAMNSAESAWKWKPVDAGAAVFLGNIQLSQGNWEEAYNDFKSGVHVAPDNSSAYSGLSTVAQLSGNSGAALGWSWMALGQSPSDGQNFIHLGNVDQSQGDLGSALSNYQLAIQTDPFTPSSYLGLGNFQLSRSQYEDAIASFQKALAIDASTTQAYRGISKGYVLQGQLPDALENLNKAAETHPPEGENRVNLASVYIQQGNPDAAINQLLQSIQSDPGYSQAYLKLGQIYLDLGRDSDAEAIYHKLVNMGPMYPQGYLVLGQLYEQMGKTDEATAVYQLGLGRISPHIAGSIDIALANLLERQGQTDQALAYYQASIQQQPMLDDGYVALATFQAQYSDLKTAQKTLEQGLSLLPASNKLNLALAENLTNQGEIEQAIQVYQTAEGVSIDPATIVTARANLYAMLGQPGQAMAEIERARRNWQGNTQLLQRGASLAAATGNPQQAVNMALALANLAPGYASSWTALGDAYTAQGVFNMAEYAYRWAVHVSPGDSGSWLSLGNFLASRGEYQQALDALHMAIQTDARSTSPHLAIAQILLKQGQPQAALAELQTAAGMDASQNAALLAIGRLQVQEGNLSGAHNTLLQAISIAPLDPGAYKVQSDLFLKQGWFAAAQQSLVNATVVAPGSCTAFLNLGNYLAARGQVADAQTAFQKSLQLAGCVSSTHLALGNLALNQADSDQAIAEYTLATQTSPGRAWGYIALAGALDQQAKSQQADSIYESAMAKIPGSSLLEIARSNRLLGEGKLQDALTAAQECVQLAPGPNSYISLGQVYQALGQFDQAETAYHQAVTADQSASSPYVALGNLYQSRNDVLKAENAYQQAVKMDPANPDVYMSLASFFDVLGRNDDAITAYNQGAAADYSQIQALLGLAVHYEHAGQVQQASDTLHKALTYAPRQDLAYVETDEFTPLSENPPDYAQATLVLGDLYRMQSDWADAEKSYQQAIEQNPGSVDGYLRLGQVYQIQGMVADALQVYEQAVKAAPGKSAGYLAQGDLNFTQANWSDAEAAYHMAAEIDPGNPDGYLRLAYYDILRNQYPQAKQEYEAALAIAPTSAQVYTGLGDWYRSRADLSSAQDQYLKAIQMEPASPDGYIALGNLFNSTGLRGNALAQFQTAIEAAPTSPQAYIALGDWYRMENSWEDAITWYQKAIQVDTTQVDSIVHLGYAYLGAQNPDQAEIQFQLAQALAPGNSQVYIALGDFYQSRLELSASKDIARQELAQARSTYVQDAKNGTSNEFIDYMQAGFDYQDQGQTDLANEQFNLAIQADPTSLLPYFAMGKWYETLRGLPQTEQAYQKAIDLEPGEVFSYLRLGKLYQDTQRSSDAYTLYEQAVQIAPGSPLPYIRLGDWHKSRYEWAAAEQSFLQAISTSPGDVDSYLGLGQVYQTEGKQQDSLNILEQGVVSGVSSGTAICGPGRLPPSGAGNISYNLSNALTVNASRCQWEDRPWSAPPDPIP